MTTFKITWNLANASNDIQLIEDPILGSFTPKDTFYSLYKEILDELDGRSEADHFDFFFNKNPLNQCWMFIGDTEKEDFLDWCNELNLLPSLKEIHCGETNAEKQKRNLTENSKKYSNENSMELLEKMRAGREKQKELLKKQKEKSKMNANSKKQEQIQKTIQKINKQLENPEISSEKKSKLIAKLARINNN